MSFNMHNAMDDLHIKKEAFIAKTSRNASFLHIETIKRK